MPLLQALVLGVVQGLSEFLPISSSGHLRLVPWAAGWEDLEPASLKQSFDVALHLGTLVAVVVYFRGHLAAVARAGVVSLRHPLTRPTGDGRLAWLLLVATIPAGLVGLVAESVIEEALGRPWIIAVSLILFGLVLAWADRATGTRQVDGLRLRDAVVIGLAQTLALNPGTSRSGITMSAARRLGLGRDAAARVSFLMSVPVIAGAVVVELGGLVADGVPAGVLGPMAVGVVTAGVAGWAAVWGTLRLVRTRSLAPFVWYRVTLGLVVLVVLAAGWR